MPKNTGLNPRNVFAENFPNWEKPVPVSCFSINAERFYEPDCSNLRYLKVAQNLPLDLNVGVEFAKRKPETDEALDHLLEHIMNSYLELTTSINKNIGGDLPLLHPLYPVEFVAWRGLLRRIMGTPFEFENDWIIRVTQYKGTLYLCELETKERRAKCRNDERKYSWNYKFEQYCLTKSPTAQPNTDAPFDECSEFICVFHTRLVGLSILYGADMDGIKSDRPINIKSELQSQNLQFVALKTDDRKLHWIKERNWWCQSFLIGIDNIIVGWRDEKGMVESIEEIKVGQLTKRSKNWTPNQCANFLVDFLKCVKTLMAAVDCPYTVYEFRYCANTSLITYDVFEGLTLKTILPDYYINFVERLCKSKV